jgi:tetratricopeptide (TPR) repeat protein
MRSANREAVAGFEQALVALQHLPDTRETRVQAVDLRFDLRNTLLLLGEHERIFAYMREAEALARALDDDSRHARVSAYLCTYLFTAGDYDQALAAGEHALAIVATLADFPLHVEMNFRLGQVYHAIGEYPRSMNFLRRNVESLTGELLYERFGHGYVISVFSRAWLGWCLAEVGEFGEGLTLGEEGLQVAEAVDQPFSRIAAYYIVLALCIFSRETSTRPSRCWNGTLRSARPRTIGSSSRGWPQAWASPCPVLGLSP